MTAKPKLTLRSLGVRAVNAPLARPVRTASGNIEVAPLVLLGLVTEEGVVGTRRSHNSASSLGVLSRLAIAVRSRLAPHDSRHRGEVNDRVAGFVTVSLEK